ncbi:MAG: zinc-dependent metalloprotease [bacterium]
MHYGRLLTGLLVTTALLMGSVTPATAGRRVKTFGPGVSSEESKEPKKKKDGDEKPFAEMIKDKVAIEGLFTFYHDTTDNSWLMALSPEQLGPVYLCGITRSATAGAFYDQGAMGRTFPFFVKRVGKNIMFMEKNLRFRADSTAALARALPSAVSDHLWATTEIVSLPQDSTNTVLIKPDDLFVLDINHVGYFLGNLAKTGMSMDKNNSYLEQIKSFPENTEIDTRLHFKTNQPLPSSTMQNPYSMFHRYHFSLSSIPETDYMPRIADDRVGHFQTMYQDYTNLDVETPYIRFIDRWNLKKKFPDSALSEPVEPIVFWIENTVPEEYRPAMVKAVEFWNPSFEKIGFKNVMVAKQMPDTADWDPADVRYNVIRWMIQPGAAYAVGPSRANPYTGQIYDADIRFSSDWVRYMYTLVEYFIDPVSFNGDFPESEWTDPFRIEPPSEVGFNPGDDKYGRVCNYAQESAQDAAFGMAYLSAVTDDLEGKDSVLQHYVNTYLTEILAHEVGHTLGFRHNFKASTIYTLDQINDPNWTRVHSTSGTIMDYLPPNIAGPDKPQGDFFAHVPGPFDDWMTEYAYSEFGAATPEEELPQLEKIAEKAPRADLIYGTDEDAVGWSTQAVDPYCNLHDHGSDPLAYAQHRVNLTRHLWHSAIDRFDKPGNRYQKMLQSFQTGWRAYRELALIASKFIGGLQRYNHHIGDPGGKIPFETIPAATQRRAIAMLKDNLFAADAFDLPADLLNKLQPERFGDFNWSVYSRPVDYPLHQAVINIQMLALSRLYSPTILMRLVNNVERYADNEEPYTTYDLFTEVRRAIWSEIVAPENVNSFRRQLQLAHLNLITRIYLSEAGSYPVDARTLAANDLSILLKAAKNAVASGNLDQMTKAHFAEVTRQIEAAQSASRSY